MDRHDLHEAVTAEAVAKIHQEDLKIQDQFGCRGLTYWFDEKRGTAFCLIEAPEESAVKDMHNQAHGMIPNQIIEVDTQVVNAFLGRIEDPYGEKAEYNIINEPAFRTIMITCLPDVAILTAKVGRDKAQSFIEQHNHIIYKAIKQFEGREVKCLRGSFIVSFQSTIRGMHCAREIQNEMQHLNHDEADLKIKIGISAGAPVNKSPELFGQTICLTQRLCDIAASGQIVISSEVKEELAEELPDTFYDDKTRVLNPANEKFLNSVIEIIESMWNVTDFNIREFGKKLGLSKAQLYRKLTKLSGFSPNDFIKEYRLKKAAEAIGKQEGNVSEIAYRSGFSSPSYFSKCFLERFGILPSSFAAFIN
jgi:AraC-like DNA-binding protein